MKLAELHARDLVGVPGMLSLLRIPLAALFALAPSATTELAVLACAGATDLADGWYARRFARATPTGALVDPVTDKIFVATVITTLVLQGRLALALVPLLAVREALELALLLRLSLRGAARGAEGSPAVNALGKLVTLAQFACVAAAILGAAATAQWAIGAAAAALGLFAGSSYWLASLRARAAVVVDGEARGRCGGAVGGP